MNTNKFNSKNLKKKQNLLELTKKNHPNHHQNSILKRKFLFFRSDLTFIISFLLLFNFSLSQTEYQIYMQANLTQANNNLQIIGTTDNVKSITVGGKPVDTSTQIPAVKGINEIIVTYNAPITNCNGLLKNSKVTFIDMSQFDTSQCTDFSTMFMGCSSVTSIILGDHFDTKNGKDMTSMFANFGNKNYRIHLDFSKFDTSEVTSMSKMFNQAKFKYLDLTSFDTSKVKTMESMFASCGKLLSVNLSSFDTSKVTKMNQMFSGCNNIISLDISNFKLDSIQETNQMFYQMKGFMKFCDNTSDLSKIQDVITQGNLNAKCSDPCFTNSVNKFFGRDCFESCLKTQKNFYEYDSECLTKCPYGTEENPKGSYICREIIDCSQSYYNYDKTECIDEIPEGFYCDDETKKTINKCQDKCKTCELKSVEEDLCIKCNEDNYFFEAEDYSNSKKYVDCFTEVPEGYFFEGNKFKKCYESCKYCTTLGDSADHKCSECKSNMIQELGNNCYEICPENQLYYFDEDNNYQCCIICPVGYNLISQKNKCTKDCRNDSPYIYQYDNTCLEECPQGYHAPNDDKVCVIALKCDLYYNYDYTGCLNEIPEGYFCNSTEKKTIDKCKQKCKKCSLESHNKDLCTECNNEDGYYKLEDDSLSDINQFQCFNIIPEGYYLDKNDNLFKKCYKTCKFCNSLGNAKEHLCKECPDNYTLNGTNCYEICDYHYYFDSSMEYFCTKSDQCPQEKSKLIVDKNECVEECTGDYKFEFENKCYKACPPNSYYNFEQTNCIAQIPEGYFLNETQTIDKCDKKCKECDINSVSENICIYCNNSLGFYKKEDDIRNQYYDCFTGEQEGYFLDISNKEYKKCYKTCKKCNELGNVKDNKCTECFSNSTLNETNCYEICSNYHYFDESGEYHCSIDKECPDGLSKLVEDKNECVEKCGGEDKLEFDNKCYSKCPNGTYYNFNQDGCIDDIPTGYYINDSIKKTIGKCDIKCENDCILDGPINKVTCKSCNEEKNYYRKEEDENNEYYDCYNGQIENFYLDNNIYKRCFKTCKNCNELGDNLNHKCIDCYSNYTLNNSNCYEICNYFYYFDKNKIYHCTEKDECPPDFPNKIIEKKTCVSNCSNDQIYKYNYNRRCYETCPDKTIISKKYPHTCEDILICPKYYNYEKTECLEIVPDGFYLNDSLAKTIDKCLNKCSKCDTNSVDLDLCISCNNLDNFYQKQNDDSNFDKYINCYNSSFEGFYLDIEDKSYNKCFEKCKNCNEKGAITDHKCTECNEGFTLNGTNCYEICPFYYYFDSKGIYHCTEKEKCPKNYKFIPEKNQCIDNCKNDDIYKYTHRGICLDAPYIPNCNDTSIFIEKETGRCTDECEVEDFLSNYCIPRNNEPNSQDYIIDMLIEAIENGYLDQQISEMLEGEFVGYLVMERNVTYHLTTIRHNNLIINSILNVSSLNLGDCENRLKDKYNIDKDLPLIILKIDYYINHYLIPIIFYEVFDPITKKKLDLSICENNILNLKVPTKTINESTIYKYIPNSDYYINECNSTSTESEYDIILTDRQNDFIGHNLSICENNCIFKEYDSKEKKSFCVCNIKTKLLSVSEINNKNDLFFKDFPNSKGSYFNTMKCISTLLSKEGIIKNYAFYIYIILLISMLICCFLFFRRGYHSLINEINRILLKKEKNEEDIAKKEKLQLENKKEKGGPESVLKLKTPKCLKAGLRGAISKYDINYLDNYSTEQKSTSRKLEIYKFGENAKDNIESQLETDKELTYSEYEINLLTFKEAIGVDLRAFRQIYISLINYNHPLFFLINSTKEYNSIYTKISLIIISISLHYFINGLFITKSIIHEIYKTGNSNINKFIPYVIISFIICYILDKIIRFVSLSDNNIYSINKEELFNNAKIKANHVIKIIFIKYICFYSLAIVSIIFFGYYLSSFGAVYQNTQIILVRNAFISYVISLLFPFIIIILPSILRRHSLKDSTRGWIFNISRYLQYL